MGSNIFGNDDKEKHEFNEKVNSHAKAILTVVERQKDLESSLDLLNDKIEMLDHNSVKSFKDISIEIKSIKEDLKEIKFELNSMKEFSKKISKQLKLVASKDEVKKLEKYIDLWNPMDFMTREEVYSSMEDNKSYNKLITKKNLEEFEERVKKEMKDELISVLEKVIKD